MKDILQAPTETSFPLFVAKGEDRFGNFKTLGISSVAFKVTAQESKDFFMVEITLKQKGGPARHLHYYQDEWFYVVEGEFLIEAGDQRFRLHPGDSLFVPMKMAHVWAFVAGTQGRLLASVMPAGKLEAFFNEASKENALPGPDQNQWHPYDMEWVGPPLQLE